MPNKFEMTPHTEAKHNILQRYLEQWFPILNTWQEGVAYIDGFAGPGVYSKGEPGSPIIALKTANKYSDQEGFYARLWFIEPEADYNRSLREQVGKVKLEGAVRVEGTLCSTFEESFAEIVASLQEGGSMPPTFAFVDPNGYSGAKMDTLTDFLKLPRCEFLFTFMEKPLKRFISLSEEARKQHLTDLFGTSDWDKALTLRGREQIGFFLNLYTDQLKLHGVTHTLAFEMRDENEQTIYHLVFATNSKRGLEAMKESMVKVDPKFTFRISDVMVPGQTHLLSFGDSREWYKYASDLIFQNYCGKCDIPLEDIKCFVISATPYVWRAGIIRHMQKSGLVVAKVPYEPTKKTRKDLKYKITFANDLPNGNVPIQARLDQSMRVSPGGDAGGDTKTTQASNARTDAKVGLSVSPEVVKVGDKVDVTVIGRDIGEWYVGVYSEAGKVKSRSTPLEAYGLPAILEDGVERYTFSFSTVNYVPGEYRVSTSADENMGAPGIRIKKFMVVDLRATEAAGGRTAGIL